MTPVDVAICNIWFDGAYLRLLLHVGSLRRELRLLGFEESAARWLDGEIAARYKGLGLKGKVSVLRDVDEGDLLIGAGEVLGEEDGSGE